MPTNGFAMGPEDVFRRFLRVLGWVAAASPGDRVGGADLDAAERRQVLAGWNDTGRVVPAVTVPGLFAAQAARAPDAVAVVCGDGRGDLRGAGCAGGAAGGGTWRGWGRGRSRWWGCAWSGAAEMVVALLAV